jgi:AcrR family transcriptional regulator
VERLQGAAFELFTEQGFERTTVAEIARRAGLTERTFFNHFAAKREVVFAPLTERQREIAVSAIAACDDAVPPLDAVLHGLQVANKDLEHLRAEATLRREIIDAAPELQEREVAKLAALTSAIAAALHDRGLDADMALFIARAGVLIEQTAEHKWAQPGETRSLHDLLADALVLLRRTLG